MNHESTLTEEERTLLHDLVQKECDRVIQLLDDSTMWENKNNEETVTVMKEGEP